MNIFKKILNDIVEKMVRMKPNVFLKMLVKNHKELLTRNLNDPSFVDSTQIELPDRIDGFEDLSFLFFNCPLNRGIIRQDFDEASLLYKYVARLQEPIGVEIGRFSGGSTMLLAAAVGPAGKLISVDISPADDSKLRKWLTSLGLLGRVELIVDDANSIACNDPLDFILIDGDHTYEAAKRDHNLWGSRLKSGGLIFHHDMSDSRPYSTQWAELKRLKENIICSQEKTLKLIDEAGSMTVFQKISGAWIMLE